MVAPIHALKMATLTDELQNLDYPYPSEEQKQNFSMVRKSHVP